jgi:dTDP-glucose pyrophosphorylase
MTMIGVRSDATMEDAALDIERSKISLTIVSDAEGRLLGTVTDGDIRRALLAGYPLNHSVTVCMNEKSITAHISSSKTYQLDLLRNQKIVALPLLDSKGCCKRIVRVDDLVESEIKNSAEGYYGAVIMAGGEGRRLRPLTEKTPKPMLRVGGMPLIERQVQRIVKAGIKRIFISVNHLSSVIEKFFGDGENYGVPIQYLREDKKLGTGGSLSLLPSLEKIDGPLIIINGDVVTTSDYANFLSFHKEHGAMVTVGVVDYYLEIPYGVIRVEGVDAVALEEKPSQHFFCNAGIYVISPEALKFIPREQEFNMTDLIDIFLEKGVRVVVFPIHEFWTDIGTPIELEKASEAIKNLDNKDKNLM